MKRTKFLLGLILLSYFQVKADNPLVTHIYTADPTARVFNDTLYIYPSHDIPEYGPFKGNNDFMMEDYHVFSTTDLMNYTDHGVILHEVQIKWTERNSFEMWAPCCNTKNGKYYFYFPAKAQVGVAVADHPTGPFEPVQKPIANAGGIDPNLFMDDDGTPYLFFGHGEYLKVMRMKDNMVEPDMDPVEIQGLPKEYKEGAFAFKRNGIYYLTFPMAKPKNKEEICYATADNPLGPYEYKGVIMDQWPNCWTNHHSIVNYKGEWLFFYHYQDLSGDGSLRNMRAEKLFFNEDGSIQKVIPTRRGIGIRKASEQIQVDRFDEGTETLKSPVLKCSEPAGFFVSNITNNSWLKYPDVDFENNSFDSVSVRVASEMEGGTLELRLNSKEGKLLGEIAIPNTGGKDKWQTVKVPVNVKEDGVKDLVLVFKGEEAAQNLFFVNWVTFIAPGSETANKQ